MNSVEGGKEQPTAPLENAAEADGVAGLRLLVTRIDKRRESEIARIEELAIKTELALKELLEEAEVLRRDAEALRGTVRILLEVDYAQTCSECGASSEGFRICEPCSERQESIKARARLKVA